MSPFITGGIPSTTSKQRGGTPLNADISTTDSGAGPGVRQLSTTPSGAVWYTIPEVAALLKYGLNKTKKLVHEREIRSVKDGKYRRILPEWVDEYVRSLPEDV